MISTRDSTQNRSHRRWHNFHTLSILYKKYKLNRKLLLQVKKVKQYFYHSILTICKILTRPISPRVMPKFLVTVGYIIEEELFGDRNVKNNKYNNKPTKEAPNKWERIVL